MTSYMRYSNEENIYNLIPPEVISVQKPPTHVSKYPHNTPPTASTFGTAATSSVTITNMGGAYEPQPTNHRHIKAGATFGPKADHYSDPTAFLTKQNKPPLPEPKRFAYTDQRKKFVSSMPLGETLPAIPNATASKDYIKANTIAAITQKPGPRPTEHPRFVDRPGYGQAPSYLQTVRQEIIAEKEYIAAALDQQRRDQQHDQGQMRLLPEAERLKLLDNLKTKWESVNKAYQGMTHAVVLDTVGKIRRKEEYESQMQNLEKSIEKLSKPYVFVQDS